MPKYIIKLKDKYLEWSSVTDSPTTRGLPRNEMISYLWRQGIREIEEEIRSRLERTDKYGSSMIPPESAEDVITCNQLGYNGTELTAEEIYERYCNDVSNELED